MATSTTSTEVGPGLLYEKIGKVFAYTMTSNSQATVDAWVKHYDELLKNHPSDKLYWTMMDTSTQSISFSPYFRQGSQKIVDMHGHLRGYVAIILPNRLLATVLEFFMRAQRRKKFEPRCFTEREKALAWLEQSN